MGFIEHIYIEALTLEYGYDSDGLGSHFLISSVIHITDDLPLPLPFKHFPDHREFDTGLLDTRLEVTINDIIAGLCDGFILPSYVDGINLTSDAELQLRMRKPSIEDEKCFLFWVELSIGPFDVLFVQYKKDGCSASSYRGEACQHLNLDLVDLEVKGHFRIKGTTRSAV
jgi:hypothetical protein